MKIEAIIDVLLDKNSREKMSLLEYLNTKNINEFSINQLCNELTINYQKLDSLIVEIHDDFKKLNWEAFIVKKGIVSWNRNASKLTDFLRYLVKNSLNYQIIKCALLNPNCGIKRFAENNYVSRSTVIRRAKNLKQHLTKYDIQLNLFNMSLDGPHEENIQNFLYVCFWFSSFGEDLLCPSMSWEAELELVSALELSSASLINKKRALLCLAITRHRLHNQQLIQSVHYPVPLFPEKVLLIKNYFEKNFPTIRPEKLEPSYLFLYYKIIEQLILSNSDRRIKRISAFYFSNLNEKRSASSLTELFVMDLQKNFFKVPLFSDELSLLQCNLFLAFRFLKTPSLIEFIHLQTTFSKENYQNDLFSHLLKISQHTLNTISDELSLLNYRSEKWKKNLATYLVEIVYPYSEAHYYLTPLQIGIQMMPNHHFMMKLVAFLNQVNFVKHEVIQDGKVYDFCIGNNEAELPNCQSNYLLSFKNEHFEGELFQKLLTCLQTTNVKRLSDIKQSELDKSI